MTDKIEAPDEMRAQVAALVRKYLHDWDDGEIPATARLADLGLDSMNAVNLVLDLESSFAILFADEMLTPERFETLERVTELVSELVSSR